jgi:hypothetical protein
MRLEVAVAAPSSSGVELTIGLEPSGYWSFACGGDLYCCRRDSILTPLGRWLAVTRGPLLFMAKGCQT